MKTCQAGLAANKGEILCGTFQSAPDAEVTKILDIQTLLAAAFTSTPRAVRKTGNAINAKIQEKPAEALQMLISFEVGGQEYALPLQDVQEIAPLPASIALVSHSEALLLGVVSLRGMALPLLSLRGLLGFQLLETQSSAAKIIVTLVAGIPVGLVADRVKAVISAPSSSVQPAPALLAARMGGEARLSATYRDETGRIVAILAVKSLFGEEVMARLSREKLQQFSSEAAAEISGPTRQFLVFRLADEEFGLPIDAVDEVAAVPEKITRLPKTPKFLEGVVNMRGTVLPVINQRRRFDMPDDRSSEQRLLVVRTQRHRAGLLVDSISGVVSTPEDDIEPAPHLSGEHVSMVNGVLNLKALNRMVLLLNPEELLSRTERNLLDNFASRQKHAD